MSKTNKRNLFIQIAGATSALVLSAGIVFGLTTTSGKITYLDYATATHSLSYGQDNKGNWITPIKSKWNDPNVPLVKEKCFFKGNTNDTTFNDKPSKYNFSNMIVDGHDHTALDKSFNQSAYRAEVDWTHSEHGWQDITTQVPLGQPNRSEGYKPDAAGDYSGKADKPINDSISGFTSTYLDSVENGGAKSLILPGFLHQTPLETFGKDSASSKAGYILLDSNFGTPSGLIAGFAQQVASVMFRSDQSAFLAGLAAGQYLNENFYEYYKPNKPLAVGTFGGLAIPTVTMFMGGFQYGIYIYNLLLHKYWSAYSDHMVKKEYWKNGEQNDEDKHLIKFINLGSEDSWFSGTFAMGDGKACAQTLLAYGADVIMPVAGPQTIDTVQEIKNQKSNCIVVGVDTPQEESDMNDNSVYTDKSGNNKIIKFSAQKNIVGITEQILDLAYSASPYYEMSGGTWTRHDQNSTPYNEADVMVGSYGFLTIGNVANDGVKSSANSDNYLVNLFQYIGQVCPDYPGVIKILSDYSKLPSPDTQDPISVFDDLGSQDHSEHMVWKW